MKPLKRILECLAWVGRPVWRELPFFLAAVAMLSPTAWYEIGKLTLNGQFSLESYYVSRAAIFINIAMVWAYVLTVVVYLIRRRWLKIALYVLMLFNLLVGRFIFYNFNAVFSPQLAIIIGETNPSESKEFLGAYLGADGSLHAYAIVLLVAGLIVLLEALWRVRRSKPMWLKAAGSIALAALLVKGVSNMRYTVEMLGCDTMEELEKTN